MSPWNKIPLVNASAGTAFFSDPSEKGLAKEPLRRNGSEK
jgi:hypothetical protein|tara:strand:- start:180 stop:299 length:120 start_codon:yes stop_codon:yes gene_type:complete